MSAPSLSVDACIERKMIEFGSGILTDIDRMILGPNSKCDIYGFELDEY